MRARLAALALLIALLAAGCASPIADTEPAAASIWVIRHGWHSGIALARADIPSGRWPEAAHFPRALYLEAGWGDRDFYMAPGFNAWYGIKALFGPTPSVVHLVGFDAHPERAFPSSEVVEHRVSRRGLERLVAYLEASFDRQGKSEAAPLGRGLYGVDSAFYPSTEKFNLFNTCNTWTARALTSARAESGAR
jgi:uncharacterized protein (TIGR02117 family)